MHLWLPADAFKGVVPDSCNIEDDPSNLNILVFVGNVLLVAGFLLAILLFHITVISGVEAYMLVKASAALGSSCVPFSFVGYAWTRRFVHGVLCTK